MTTSSYSLHPAAELFPVMDEAAFAALVADIATHGQREPILIHNGQVIDGRHRLRACEQLGIEPGAELKRAVGPPHPPLTIDHHGQLVVAAGDTAIGTQLA